MEVSRQLHASATLRSRKEPQVPIEYEAGWAPEPVWMLWRRKKSSSCRESNHGFPACSPRLYRLNYPIPIWLWWLLFLYCRVVYVWPLGCWVRTQINTEVNWLFYCLRFETSLFVASYDSQGHGGGELWTSVMHCVSYLLGLPIRGHRVEQFFVSCLL
jgi:hypothetical protein